MTKEKKYGRCKRCGRRLKNPESVKVGYGMVCYQKILLAESMGKLFEPKGKKE